MPKSKSELLPGTLDLLILKTLSLAPMHGYGISRRLTQISGGIFEIKAGTFFPALYRLEEDGLISGEWGVSENNRRARFYRLTATGRKKFQSEKAHWKRSALAITRVLAATLP